MSRPLRIEFEDAIYHVCARGNAGESIFRSQGDRVQFVRLLEQSSKRFGGAVFCFVLMGNHFHLLVQTSHPNLSRWMHWLIVSYSVSFNRRHHRSGHLFQGRYKSFLVETGEYLLALSRYIHLNPVRGLKLGRGNPMQRRRRLRDFKWSSYRGYAALAEPFNFVQETIILDELSGSKQAARLSYRRFVEEALTREIDNPFEAVRWQVVLGRENFLRRVRDRVKCLHKQKREIPSLRQALRFVEPTAVLKKVAKKFNANVQRLRSRSERGSQAKNVAMWMIWELCGMTLREVGEFFSQMDYSAVAQRIRRTRLTYSEQAAQALIEEMSNVEM